MANSKASEVDLETQAQIAIKLADSVRDLIRKEIKAALEDYTFTADLKYSPAADNLADVVAYKIDAAPDFGAAVSTALKTILTDKINST